MRLRVLGPVCLTTVEEDRPLGKGRTAALLALLCVTPNAVVSADRLIDELWGDDAPTGARNALQAIVTRLRRALPADMLITRRPGYLRRVDPEEIDARHFEGLVAEGGTALGDDAPAIAAVRLAEALSLWRGQPFDGLDSPTLPAEVTRLTELRIVALELRLGADLALGRHLEVSAELEGLVEAHPLRERFREHLMLARYRAGRQAEALEAYREGYTVLADEPGIEPGAGLRRLHEAVRAQDPSLDPPAVGSRHGEEDPGDGEALPLLGRRSHLAALADALRLAGEGRGVLALVEGPVGSGKSRLLDAFTESVSARTPRVRSAATTSRPHVGVTRCPC